MTKNLKCDFINSLRSKSKSENTIQAYSRNLDLFFEFLEQQNKSILKVNHTDMEKFLLFLLEKGNRASTRSQKLSTVKTFYNFLQMNELVEKNPCLYIDSPKLEKKLPVHLSSENINKLIEEAQKVKKQKQDNTQRNTLILHLLVNCGLRISELVNIKIEDIDMLNNLIIVTGKGNKQRVIGFNEITKKAITTYLQKDRKKVVKNNCPYLILNSRTGEQLKVRVIQKLIKELSNDCLDSNLAQKVTPHKFRHTCATMLYENGIDVFTLQLVLGHSNLNTTKIYTHVANAAVLAATQNFTV